MPEDGISPDTPETQMRQAGAPSQAGGSGRARARLDTRASGLPGAFPSLPPTARRLLAAARRLLARSGYNSLTIEAIGREAGENKALIRYYFGSKDGLLVALVDELVSEAVWQARQRLSVLSGQENGAHLVVEVARAFSSDSEAYRLFYDLLPRLLEKPTMAQKLAHLYRIHRHLNSQALSLGNGTESPEMVQDIAAMTVALTDGLALQLLAEPGSVNVARALQAWRAFVETTLPSTTTPTSNASAANSSNGVTVDTQG